MGLTMSEYESTMGALEGVGGAITREPFEYRIEDEGAAALDEARTERTIVTVLGGVVLALGLTGCVWLLMELLGR